MSLPTDQLARAAAVLAQAPVIALACHVSPDGDALGSTVAFAHLAKAAGKEVVFSWPDPFDTVDHYAMLPGLNLAVPSREFPLAPAVMCTFDCGSLGRLNELAIPANAAGELIVMDHHRSNDKYGTINVIDPDAAATAVVVREVARVLGWPLTRDAAYCLYVALIMDTGRFQYASTTAAVFELAAELASFDLPIADLSRKFFEEDRYNYLKLMGRALDRMEMSTSIDLVLTSVTLNDLAEFGVEAEETEGLIDFIRRAAEAEVSCVLKEVEGGFVRGSLRSLARVDVSAIAAHFGGGGHRYAAGFMIPGTIDDVAEEVRKALRNNVGTIA